MGRIFLTDVGGGGGRGGKKEEKFSKIPNK